MEESGFCQNKNTKINIQIIFILKTKKFNNMIFSFKKTLIKLKVSSHIQNIFTKFLIAITKFTFHYNFTLKFW